MEVAWQRRCSNPDSRKRGTASVPPPAPTAETCADGGKAQAGCSGDQAHAPGGEAPGEAEQGQHTAAHHLEDAHGGLASGSAVEDGKLLAFRHTGLGVDDHRAGLPDGLGGLPDRALGWPGGIVHSPADGIAARIHRPVNHLMNGLIQLLIILGTDGLIHNALDVPAQGIPILICFRHSKHSI